MSIGKLLLGVVVAAAIGGGGGFALSPALERLGPQADLDSEPGMPAPTGLWAPFQVTEIRGKVLIRAFDGQWAEARQGAKLRGPLTIRTIGPDSGVSLALRSMRLRADQDAELRLAAPGQGVAVQVDAGRVVLHRRHPVRTWVPMHQLWVEGTTYGVWVLPEQVSLSVLDGELTLQDKEHEALKFARGRTIRVTQKGLEPSVLGGSLKFEILNIKKKGSNYQLVGAAPHGSIAFVTREDGQRELLNVGAGGRFRTLVKSDNQEELKIAVYDSAGRVAYHQKPSISLEDTLARLKSVPKGKTKPVQAPQKAAPAPKEAAPKSSAAPAPAEKAPAKAATEKAPQAPDKKAEAKKKPASKAAAKPAKAGSGSRRQAAPKPVSLDVAGPGTKAAPALKKREKKPETK